MNLLAITGAFMRRDWAEVRSYRAAFVFGVVDTLLRLTMFFFIAEIVDTGQIDGRDLEAGYFVFAVVGLALTQVLSSAMQAVSEKMREEQQTGTLEVVMATPIGVRELIAGLAAFEFVRAVLSGLILVVVAVVVFGARFRAEPLDYLALVPAVLGSLGLFLAVGIALAAATIVVKRTGALTAFIGEILAILGGVYFPLSVLPRPLEVLGQALPFTWAVDVSRGILIAGDVRVAKLVALVVSAAVALPASAWLFGVAARRARRDGSLMEY